MAEGNGGVSKERAAARKLIKDELESRSWQTAVVRSAALLQCPSSLLVSYPVDS
eukprot:COSAG01_NODE_65418_length_273_cov_0.867816_2_plen_53_part_01